MARRDWTVNEIRLLRWWRGQGVKVVVIARRLNRSARSVASKLRYEGIVTSPENRPRRPRGVLTRKVRAGLLAGKSVIEIATELGVYHSAVSRIRKKLDLSAASRADRVKLSWVFRRARGDKPWRRSDR
jgi:hypothetical protein